MSGKCEDFTDPKGENWKLSSNPLFFVTHQLPPTPMHPLPQQHNNFGLYFMKDPSDCF